MVRLYTDCETLWTRWWFQIFFYFHTYLGKISILTNIFQGGWNHQLVKCFFYCNCWRFRFFSWWWRDIASCRQNQLPRSQGHFHNHLHLMVDSNFVYFHPCLGKTSNLTNIFQMGWKHQLVQGDELELVEIGSLIRQKPASDQDLASDASAAPCSVEALEAILAKMKQILGKKRFRSGLPPDAKGFFQDRVLRDCKKKSKHMCSRSVLGLTGT